MKQYAGYCTLCRSRCGSLNQVEQGRLVKVLPLHGHPTGGALCAKGRAAPELVASPLRLTRPLRRTAARGAADPQWQEIGWDEALDTIATRLLEARARDGAESVAFAVTTPSGTPMVDSFEWVERFIRSFGSPNLLYAIEVCGWHKDYAHALTFGRGIGVPDLEHADVVVLWGFNPARTWLAQASRVAAARQRGARVVVVDPKQDGSAQQADLWLPVRPGADATLALGAIRHLLATHAYDAAFVGQWTNAPLLVDLDSGRLLRGESLWDMPTGAFVVRDAQGALRPFTASKATPDGLALFAEGECRDRAGAIRRYASVLELLRRRVEPYTPEHVARLTWVDEQRIGQFNALFMHGPKLAYHAWTGVGQHTNATQTERAIATLYALTGACDRQGGNLWLSPPPYRTVNDYQALLPAEQRNKALGLAELPLGPPRHGWVTARDLRRAVLHKQPYPVRTLVSFGTNLLVTQADTAMNRRMLEALDFHVHVDVFMNPTAQCADIVLPASMPWEREALKCGFEITQAAVEHVQLRPRMVQPPGQARADYDIVMALARRMGMTDAMFGGDIEAGWNHQLAPLGITVDDLRAHPEGMRFPQPVGYRKFATTLPDGSVTGFATPTRRVELYAESLLEIGQPALPTVVEPERRAGGHPGSHTAFPTVLTTAKSGWFVHSSHRHLAALRRKSPAPQVQIGAGLAAAIGVKQGDWVRVWTELGSVRLKARPDAALHDHVAVAEFGWWQGCEPLGHADLALHGPEASNINGILSDSERDPVSGSVPLRAVMCRIEADARANRGTWCGVRAFRLHARQRIAQDIDRFDFAPEDGGPLPDFMPGQHVVVSLPGIDSRRAYSLIGPPRGARLLSVAVRLARSQSHPPGRMSSCLHAMALGDTVQLSAPSGVFTIPVNTTRPLVLVAGGIGITPFVGHFEALALQREAGQATPDVWLVHLAREGEAHPFAAELQVLAARIGTVRLSLAHGSVAGLGMLTDALIARRPLAYLCGSPGFLAAVRQTLLQRGMPDFDIFEETFSAEVEIPRTLAPQTIRVADDAATFEWSPALGTLLDAADCAGARLPSGCRVGQCESCVMTVAEGKVAHLAPWDGPPDRCLTCMAVPLTPVVLRR
ncbi:molybdopterin-dependent oxidoreductase [Cupriavidus gilardii]|uniref:molybdopterin-dependent oxidoreductase n=1 Tax=Cupriavidus gilardii TaxID=82541 RepID=UPI0006B2DF1A|nr:molybdopterin-dependent oxidoreductase [Cupriavidus gilardii]MCT9014649.1 molybdopterin-dependent oxidoreductase [Cupriavidus gilardii]MCT9054369.1 molybdopterin-dependent oxidoreductase [Cupriavidus gilardii]WNG68246.1 molybdopterin-dependent oxidoreductase [Cupriavidus gilardii]